MTWYTQTHDQLFEKLQTSEKGLSDKEVEDRIKQYGHNELAVKKESFWKLLIEPFRSVFVAVLGVAAAISLLSHEVLDAAIIAAIIIVNAIIFYSQQYATNRVLRSLRRHSVSKTKVIRNETTIEISSLDIVPGDILLLAEGERIAADGRLIHVENLQVNEASLTGESLPIHKHASTLTQTHPIYEQDNMAFQGTYVVAGTGRLVVVATGNRTEFGKIAQLAAKDQTKSPVQERIDKLIGMLVKAIATAALAVFILSLVRGMGSGESLRFVLSLSVSAVPEGLPVALTAIIVLGMRRMANKQALVRSFKAIEDVGLVTAIATDKTGTLTKNHLAIAQSWDYAGNNALAVARNTLDSQNTTDPLDIAIADSSKHPEHSADTVYPFDIGLRMSGAYSKSTKTLYIKGSPEHILAKAGLPKDAHQKAESAMHEFTAKGFRVIATAIISNQKVAPPDLSTVKKIDFAGFVALEDELRPEAAQAIAAAQSAGIKVQMITGDHYETAYNIAKSIGLAKHPDQVVQGEDLPKEKAALAALAQQKTVFARILPEQKFRILEALKEKEITAMTGDGVNDVPALANAHVGFAMGSGSDIAKDAGGIVLLNDNFATIVQAIREGRKIYDNIRKMLFYLLSTSLGEVITMIGSLLLGLPLPVTAIQILWINLVTDTALVLPLGLEPEEEGIMNRPPRKPNEPLLSRTMLTRMILVASAMALVTVGIVRSLTSNGYSVAEIQTVAFLSLIVAQWTNALNARSETHSSLARLRTPNRSMLVGFIVAVSLQLAVMYGPLGPVFNIQNVPSSTLLVSAATMAFSVLGVAELHKIVARRYRYN